MTRWEKATEKAMPRASASIAAKKAIMPEIAPRRRMRAQEPPQTCSHCNTKEKEKAPTPREAKDSEEIATPVGNMGTLRENAKAKAKEVHRHWEHYTKEKAKAKAIGKHQAKATVEKHEDSKVVKKGRKEEKDSKGNAGAAG